MPVMRWRVVCGFRDVMLIRAPTSAFSSVDLPTDGLPTIATWPQRCRTLPSCAGEFGLIGRSSTLCSRGPRA
jgi:hypothetical protein